MHQNFPFQIMVKNQALSVLLFCLMLVSSYAWDGCNGVYAPPHLHTWRCGDQCIYGTSDCNCGGTIFNKEAQMWCCEESSCTGLGGYYNDTYGQYWGGEYTEPNWGKRMRTGNNQQIGAKCNGTALNLTQSCNGACNFYSEDEARNNRGILRSHSPCNINQNTTLQCTMIPLSTRMLR